MAKQRNSLGVLVLPVPYEQITWEEYKQRYGIDLNDLFYPIPDEEIFMDKGFSKLIAVSLNYEVNAHAGSGKVFFPNKIREFTIGSPTTGFGKTLACATVDSGDDQKAGEGISLYYNLSDETCYVQPYSF